MKISYLMLLLCFIRISLLVQYLLSVLARPQIYSIYSNILHFSHFSEGYSVSLVQAEQARMLLVETGLCTGEIMSEQNRFY